MTRSVIYQPIFHTVCCKLHCEHILNNVVITTIIEMVEKVEIFDGRVGKCSVERLRYVINNLLHFAIVKYGVISLVLCISTRLRLLTILTLLMKYLGIFHADLCNKSYIIYIYIYYIPPPLTVHISMTRSVRYQPILHTLYYTLHTEHAYCLSYHFLNNVVITTVIQMVEMVEILDGRLGKRLGE